MILQSFWESLLYVMADSYFLASMAAVVMVGLFIGATLYDGCIKEAKKMMISLFTYALMISTVTSSRVLPLFFSGKFIAHHPFSGIATVLLVTVFYLTGLWIGVKITKLAHGGKEI